MKVAYFFGPPVGLNSFVSHLQRTRVSEKKC